MTVLEEDAAPAIARSAAADTGPAPDIGRLTMSCVDGPGIIALVASFLHRRGANIIQSDQYSTGPTGGRFFLRTEFHLPDLSSELGPLKRDFDAQVASALNATFRLCDASVPVRVAIFVSRRDHCLVDLLWRARRGELPIEIVTVISNHSDLQADVASFGVPFEVIPVTKATKPQAERMQLELLRGRVDLVILARYMQILSGSFLSDVGVPVINIHHSFLPAFAACVARTNARGTGA